MNSDIVCISFVFLATAFVIDLIIGEREKFPHPVIVMGWLISWGEKRFNKESFADSLKKRNGIILAISIPTTVFLLTALLIWIALEIHTLFGGVVTIYLAYTTISLKGLRDAAVKVRTALFTDNLPEARKALSHIVGRSTEELEEEDIVRGVVESVAENSSDGVIAPLFYLLIGGVPLAMAYKAINTLDSMVGYKNARFKNFGFASAKVDDVANFIPARLAGIFIVMAAPVLHMEWKRGWTVMMRDRKNHPSPNAGYPEAATAGVLGVQLGGANNYPGRQESRPLMGDKVNILEKGQIALVVRLIYLSSSLMLLFSLIIKGVFF